MNQRYEAKFGHIFIICASGKSAQEMLIVLKQRQASPPKLLRHGMECMEMHCSPLAVPASAFLQRPHTGSRSNLHMASPARLGYHARIV